MKMEVRGGTPIGIIQNSNNKSPAKFYDLSFTVYGEYISILDFVSDIENDSELGFKIENFKLTPQSGTDILQATFDIKEVSINNVTMGGASTTSTTGTTNTPQPQSNTTNQNQTTQDNNS